MNFPESPSPPSIKFESMTAYHFTILCSTYATKKYTSLVLEKEREVHSKAFKFIYSTFWTGICAWDIHIYLFLFYLKICFALVPLFSTFFLLHLPASVLLNVQLLKGFKNGNESMPQDSRCLFMFILQLFCSWKHSLFK